MEATPETGRGSEGVWNVLGMLLAIIILVFVVFAAAVGAFRFGGDAHSEAKAGAEQGVLAETRGLEGTELAAALEVHGLGGRSGTELDGRRFVVVSVAGREALCTSEDGKLASCGWLETERPRKRAFGTGQP
jgi:hypothetical protein